MMSMLDELKLTAAEMPWYFVAVLVAVMLCAGVQTEIVCGADGDRARVSIGRMETSLDSSMEHVAAACEREARLSIPVNTPGVTMLIGVRSYWFEMTVPKAAIEAKLATMRSGFTALKRGHERVPQRNGGWVPGSWDRV